MTQMTSALLIDDDQKLGDLLMNYLQSFDIDLSVVNDPRKAIETINKKNPDLLILDVMMPHINGFELCKMIRKESDKPIIILSARGEADDKIKGIDLGADDYLSKPFETNISLNIKNRSNQTFLDDIIQNICLEPFQTTYL